MSVKIDAINLECGDCFFIRFEGSVENSIFVKVDAQGVWTIHGPINVNAKTFQVTTSGIEEIPSEDDMPALQEVARLKKWDVETAWEKSKSAAATLNIPNRDGISFLLEAAKIEHGQRI